jgi:hypothetical protein
MIRRMMLAAITLVASIAISCPPTGPAAGDTEPNDSFDTAEWVCPGAWNNGATNATNMKDFYKFNLSTGQVGNINCMVGMYSSRFYFSIYDSAQALLKRSGLVEPYYSWYLNYTLGQSGGGIFYIVAEAESCTTYLSGSYGFQLTIHNQSDAGKAGDAGDAMATARQLSDGSWEGWLADIDREDWYKFAVPRSFRINATLNAGPDGSSPLMMELHRSSGPGIRGTGWLGPKTSALILWTTSELTGDTYYLSVCQTIGGGNNYSISLSVRPQNDAGAGKDAPGNILGGLALPGSGTFGGWLADDDVLDAYNISLSGGQLITCALETGRSGPDSLYLSLSRPGGDGLFNITVPSGSNRTRDWILNSTGGGIYHVGVANQNSYNLTILISSQSDAGAEGDAGENISAARQVAVNYNYTGFLGGDDGCDCYLFAGKVTQPLTVNFLATSGTGQSHISIAAPSKTAMLDISEIAPGMPVSGRVILPQTGDYFLTVLAGRMDYAFNLSIPRDTIPPSINISAPAQDDGFTTPDITVSGDSYDNVGVVLVQISRDNSTWLNCTGLSAWTGNLTLAEGANTIYVRAKDVVGNTARASRLVYYDKTPPVLNVTSPADQTVQRVSWVEVRGSASDNCRLSAVEVSLDGTSWLLANGTTKWTFANLTLAEGPNRLQVRSRDMAGNSDNWKLLVTVDTLPPRLLVSYPVNGSFLACATAELSGTASDELGVDRVEACIPGGVWRPATLLEGDNWTITGFPLGRGPNNITIRVADGAGNMVSGAIHVTLDTEPPVVLVTSPTSGKKVDRSKLTVEVSAYDNYVLRSLTLKLNGEDVPFSETGVPWSAEVSLKEGKNELVVTAMDGAGLVTTVKSAVTYEKPRPQPGFDGLLLAAGVAVGLALLAKKKRT